jgi:hypothetical protein
MVISLYSLKFDILILNYQNYNFITMSTKGPYSGVSSETHNPDGSELKCYQKPKGWICMICSCLLVIILIIVLITYKFLQYIEETNDQREVVDSRNTTISSPVTDYETDPDNYIRCSHDNPCRFECSYVKNNLHKHPDECEYDDWMDILSIILDIFICICILHCICLICGCGAYNKKTNR